MPNAPPSLLEKNSSSVSGIHTGASCAKEKLSFSAISRMEALLPNTSKNEGSKTWKNGGVVPVGLNSSESFLNGPFGPITLNDSGLTIFVSNEGDLKSSY